MSGEAYEVTGLRSEIVSHASSKRGLLPFP